MVVNGSLILLDLALLEATSMDRIRFDPINILCSKTKITSGGDGASSIKRLCSFYLVIIN